MAIPTNRASGLWGTQLNTTRRPVCRSTTSTLDVRAAQEMEGFVTSTKMQKTAVVLVTRFVPHPKYHKRVRRTKKFFAHDADEICKEGDYVRIVPTRPISKNKSFAVAEILREIK